MRSVYSSCMAMRISGTIRLYPATIWSHRRGTTSWWSCKPFSTQRCQYRKRRVREGPSCRPAITESIAQHSLYKRITFWEESLVQKESGLLIGRAHSYSNPPLLTIRNLLVPNWKSILLNISLAFRRFMFILSFKEYSRLVPYHFGVNSLPLVEVAADYLVNPILEVRQCVHSSVEVFIIAIMKTHKFIPCFKSQKSIREELKREEFFEELMGQVDRLFTPEEHEYLNTFLLHVHHHANSRYNHLEQAPLRHMFSPAPRAQESPLIHIKEDVFRDVKRTLKRVATLTQDSPGAHERTQLVFTCTPKKKPRDREYIQTMIMRDENKVGTALARIKRENPNQFKINRFKKGKYTNSKSCDKLLRDRKVLQAYDNNFLQEVLATNDSTFADEFSERYLTVEPKDKEPLYARLHSQQLAEEQKLRSINCLTFSRTPGCSRTAIKLHRRKY